MSELIDDADLARRPMVVRREVPLQNSGRGLQIAIVSFLTMGLVIAGTMMPIANGYVTTTGPTMAALAIRVALSLWEVCLNSTVTLDSQHGASRGNDGQGYVCLKLSESSCSSDAFPTAYWTRAFFFLEVSLLAYLFVVGLVDYRLKFSPRPFKRWARFTMRRHYTYLSILALCFNAIQIAGILWLWNNSACLGAGPVLAPGMVITLVAAIGNLSMLIIAYFSRATVDYEAIQQARESQRRAARAYTTTLSIMPALSSHAVRRSAVHFDTEPGAADVDMQQITTVVGAEDNGAIVELPPVDAPVDEKA